MLPRADFVVYDRNGRPSVAVEVKRKFGTTRGWATEFHRNLLADRASDPLDFFTLVTPDRLYVWNEGAAPTASPSFEIPARPALEPYFQRSGLTPESVSGETFELIVGAWLNDLVSPTGMPGAPGSDEMRALSGLANRVKGGRVEPEALG